MLARLQYCRDQGVDGGVFRPHIVSRALMVRSLASPIERLLVARRQRLIPAVLDHVELEAEPALIELNGVARAHRRLHAPRFRSRQYPSAIRSWSPVPTRISNA